MIAVTYTQPQISEKKQQTRKAAKIGALTGAIAGTLPGLRNAHPKTILNDYVQFSNFITKKSYEITPELLQSTLKELVAEPAKEVLTKIANSELSNDEIEIIRHSIKANPDLMDKVKKEISGDLLDFNKPIYKGLSEEAKAEFRELPKKLADSAKEDFGFITKFKKYLEVDKLSADDLNALRQDAADAVRMIDNSINKFSNTVIDMIKPYEGKYSTATLIKDRIEEAMQNNTFKQTVAELSEFVRQDKSQFNDALHEFAKARKQLKQFGRDIPKSVMAPFRQTSFLIKLSQINTENALKNLKSPFRPVLKSMAKAGLAGAAIGFILSKVSYKKEA